LLICTDKYCREPTHATRHETNLQKHKTSSQQQKKEGKQDLKGKQAYMGSST
jgi:hypothetical protein